MVTVAPRNLEFGMALFPDIQLIQVLRMIIVLVPQLTQLL